MDLYRDCYRTILPASIDFEKNIDVVDMDTDIAGLEERATCSSLKKKTGPTNIQQRNTFWKSAFACRFFTPSNSTSALAANHREVSFSLALPEPVKQ